MTEQEIERIATEAAKKAVKEAIDELSPSLLIISIAEHESVGSGRVIDAEKARSTPCKCFTYDSDTYAWSPGILGLISSKKNPEQYREFCALGCTPASPKMQERFGRLKGAIGEAHQEYLKGDKGIKEWWETVGNKLKEKEIEL